MPGPVDLRDFVAGFVAEAEEHLHSVNRNLVAVAEALRAGRPEPRAVRELFRSLHTVKGLASMVGAEPIVEIAHEMEGLLRLADQAGGRLSDHALDLLLQGTRALEERAQVLSKAGIDHIPAPPRPLVEALALAQSVPSTPGTRPELELPLPDEVRRALSVADREQLAQAATAGKRIVLVQFRPSPAMVARGLNITSVRSRLAGLGELVKVVPRALPSAPTGIGFCLLLVTESDDASLAQAVGGEPDAVQPVAIGSAEPSPAVPAEDLDIAEWAQGDHASIRVEVRRLDEALERLSELVVTRFKLARVASELASRGADVRELNSAIAETARQLRHLRAAITQSRMVPLADLLQRLPLVVRGLTRDTGKSVHVDMRVGGAEVDKAVADRVFPAILHLVRNAVDHAIEPRQERLRAGKPEAGTVSIVSDESAGSTLVLTVRDDGRGIDRAAVARKLGRPVAQDDEELLQQIASPGMSTREGVTHASGRGMGMDIVKRTAEMLGGALTLRSEPGRGTTFTLRVPVSITIVEAFSFTAGPHVFVAPVATVEEILEVDPAGVVSAPAPRNGGPCARLVRRRGEAIPLVVLDRVLRRSSERERADDVPARALVVQQGRGAVAFGVDRMLGQQEIVIRPLDDVLVRVVGISGATDLGDGRPTLVLDLTALGASITQGATAP